MTPNDKKALILVGKGCGVLVGAWAIAMGINWWINCGNYVYGSDLTRATLGLVCISDLRRNNFDSCYCAINNGLDADGGLQDLVDRRKQRMQEDQG